MSDQSLSREQQYALNVFNRGENVFITGPGGTGKTKLIGHFVQNAKSRLTEISVCALTGCASLLLNCGAKTLHSWSGIRLGRGSRQKIIADIMKNKRAVANWKKTKILVIDEVSMMSEKIFELCDDIGRAIRKVNRPFGGIQVVLTGDFYQLPPIGTIGEPDTERFCFESERWNTIIRPENHIQLQTMFRQTDPKYIEILLQIRKGELSEENAEILKTRVKKEYKPDENGGCMLTKLFPVRSRAELVNRIMYEKMETDEMVYVCNRKSNSTTYIDSGVAIKAVDIMKCDMLTSKEKEMHLDQLVTNCPVAETLSLKNGTVVMCLVNLDMDSGICNGSQGVVIGFTASTAIGGELSPKVRFSNGIVRVIERHAWQSDDYPSLFITQYPLCLAWALTIHKIQGATMAMAEMDLGTTVFEYGQTYVALSRIKTLDGLYLSAFHPQRIKANPIVRAFYESIVTSMDDESVEEMLTTDWNQYAYSPEEIVVKTPELIVRPPLVNNKAIAKDKDPNVKIIRL